MQYAGGVSGVVQRHVVDAINDDEGGWKRSQPMEEDEQKSEMSVGQWG